jgi:hypothetical protein
MKVLNYKQLCKEPVGTTFATLNKMNELSELFIILVDDTQRKLLSAPLTDKQIDFDENTFNRTSGAFMVFNTADLTSYIERLKVLNEVSRTAEIVSGQVPDDLRLIIPVYQEQSAHYFVSPDMVKPWSVTEHGRSGPVVFQTSAFAIGAHFSLLGISQTEPLLECGLLDITDSIDPTIRLRRVFVQLETLDKEAEIIPIVVSGYPTAQAHAGSGGNYREMQINFSTNVDLPVGIYTETGEMSKIVSHGAVPRIGVTGSVNLELGDARFVAQRIESFRQGEYLVRARVVGYELDAYRTNSNRRRRTA